MANTRTAKTAKTKKKSNKKAPTKVSLKPSRLKRLLPFLVILGFGLAGVIVLNRSNAATDPLQTFEAENMAVDKLPGDPTIPDVPDGSASKGIAFSFVSNYITARNIFNVKASNKVVIRARSDLCPDAADPSGGAIMTIQISGGAIHTFSVPYNTYHYYNIPVNLPAGPHKVIIKFTNDLWRPNVCDRNLYVDQVIFVNKPPVVIPVAPKPKPAPTPAPKKHVVTRKKVVAPPVIPQVNDYFSIVVLPDTQNEAASDATDNFQKLEMFDAQTRWIANHADDTRIKMVLHVGDAVNDLDTPSQWKNAYNALNTLDGKVPFIVAQGNHDMINYNKLTSPTKLYKDEFNNELIGKFNHYTDNITGTFKKNDYTNTYTLFSAGGVKLLVLNLQFGAPDDVLTWAGGIANQYPNYHAILLTHDFLGLNKLHGSSSLDKSLPATANPSLNNPPAIWDKLVYTHPNIQFTFSGHVTDIIPGLTHMDTRQIKKKGLSPTIFWDVARDTPKDQAGRTVFETMANYQNYFAGDGYMRVYKFYPALGKVDVSTFSAQRAADSQFDRYPNYLTDPSNNFSYTGVDLSSW